MNGCRKSMTPLYLKQMEVPTNELKTNFFNILPIAEHGNITRAAQELFISQPSLSESLNKVEQEFGTTIFDRTQDGLVLTAFGLRYLNTARKILDRFKRLETELDEYRQMRRGKLTFGIPINLGTLSPAQGPSCLSGALPGHLRAV